MKWFNQLRLKQVVAFPVETLAMVHDGNDIIDKEYKQLCAEMYAEGHSFFTYISDSADSLASCCFSKDTIVTYKVNDVPVTENIGEAYKKHKDSNILVFTYNPYNNTKDWAKASFVKANSEKLYKITFSDSSTVIATHDHIFPVICEDRITDSQTSNLVVGDTLITYDIESKLSSTVTITTIEKVLGDQEVYCFKMADQKSPYFVLANGVVTHNCRLKNELKENTFSPTSGLAGIMTGSCNVITLNLNRIVQDWAIKENKKNQNSTPNWNSLKSYLINILERVYKYHIAFKTMLYEAEEKGMFSCCNAGYIHISKLYSTIGVNGFCEAARVLGMQVSNNPEYIAFLQLILGTIKEQNKLHSIQDKRRPILFNSEAVPRRSGHVKPWVIDSKIFIKRQRGASKLLSWAA